MHSIFVSICQRLASHNVTRWYHRNSSLSLRSDMKISWPSHNSLLPMAASNGYFVQVVMWVFSCKTYLKNGRLGSLLISKMSFITKDPHDHLYKLSNWKQCIVGRSQYLLWVVPKGIAVVLMRVRHASLSRDCGTNRCVAGTLNAP